MPALRSFSFVNDGLDTSHISLLMQRNHNTPAIPSAVRATSYESTVYLRSTKVVEWELGRRWSLQVTWCFQHCFELVWDRFGTELPVNWTEDRPQAWEVNRSWTEQDRTEPYETLAGSSGLLLIFSIAAGESEGKAKKSSCRGERCSWGYILEHLMMARYFQYNWASGARLEIWDLKWFGRKGYVH
ncbi:hypothetical protein SCHPADRAFT_983008 [Schizopora paradoxa]|uniref:Uncharacterized protein n=1 Tax=Schizopora paradoxa TaxID=27342 RepID=A0A0H2R7R5_9AGAM|nr:hypothetical protein SCHPADRAFT_983008 [Schizopora paradoxa]